MLTLESLTAQIKEKSHAVVPFSITTQEFQEAMDVFVEFLKLPLETKERFYFKLIPNSRGAEAGYVRYLRSQGKTDDREYFHYHRTIEERFAQQRTAMPILDTLLKHMKYIHDTAVESLDRILRVAEEALPGVHERFFPAAETQHFYVRFLKYDRAEPGEFLARGHYDRGGCTLALAESAPGLRMGIDDLHLQEVIHKEGEALFMPAIKFLPEPHPDFPPTWHDVIQKGTDVYNDNIARWAIVFFAGSHDSIKITYEDAHTPQRI